MALSESGWRRFWQPYAHTKSLRPRCGQGLHAGILDGRDGVVDQVEVHVGAAVERGPAEAEGRLEIGVSGRGRDHEAEFSFRQVHHALRVTS